MFSHTCKHHLTDFSHAFIHHSHTTGHIETPFRPFKQTSTRLCSRTRTILHYLVLHRLQLDWHNLDRAAKEVTLCSSAGWLQLRQLTADGLQDCSRAERCAPQLTLWSWLGMWQPSCQTAAPLTIRSQSRQFGVQLLHCSWADTLCGA